MVSGHRSWLASRIQQEATGETAASSRRAMQRMAALDKRLREVGSAQVELPRHGEP